MFNDLIVASRRMAGLYRYSVLMPAHLLHAMTSIEIGRKLISDAGFNLHQLRAGLISEFKAHSVTIRDPGGRLEPSEEFNRCVDIYAGENDLSNDDLLKTLLKAILSFEQEDIVLKRVLSSSRIEGDLEQSGTACIPDLDDIMEDHFPDLGLQGNLSRKESGQSVYGRSAFQTPGASQVQRGQSSSADGRLTKEQEESRAAVLASQRDLTRLAREGRLDPIVGRDEEIAHLTQILLRRRKPNVLLVAEPGVGKSALVEGLAQAMLRDGDRSPLKDRKLIEVSLTSMVAGSRFRGDFESRMSYLIQQSEEDRAILFIDEFHTIMGSGTVGQRGMDGANILKPALARDGLSLIGATTPEEALILREDRALMRRFEIMYLMEPSRSDMSIILKGSAEAFLKSHDVHIEDEMIERLIDAGDRYLSHRRNPDRSFDLLDLAGVSARIDGRMWIIEDDLRHAIQRLGGKLDFARSDRTDAISKCGALLRHDLICAPQVIDGLVSELSVRLVSSRKTAPICLTGPSGSGKSHAVRLIAKALRKTPHFLSLDDDPNILDDIKKKLSMIVEADPTAIVSVSAQQRKNMLLLRDILGEASLRGSDGVAIDASSALLFITSNQARDVGSFGFVQSREEKWNDTSGELSEIVFPVLSGHERTRAVEVILLDIHQGLLNSGIDCLSLSEMQDIIHMGMIPDRATYSKLYEHLKREVSELLNRDMHACVEFS